METDLVLRCASVSPVLCVQVFSRASLAAAWAQDPAFLKPQLGLWLHKQQRRVLDTLWPQLLQEAAAGAKQQKKGTKRKKGKGGSK
jgi:hypothetical protein